MIGIYKYTNKYNGKVYIGQSINIERRQCCHNSASFNPKAKDYNSQFHQAVRKYGGINNFDFEIISEIKPENYSKELLDNLERYFIKLYDSYHNGYNATEGGENIPNRAQKGTKNGRALLDVEDIIYIRECYNSHVPFKQIYQEYKDKISKRGLQKIWWFETWKDILPEYHTEENKYWHSHAAKANSSDIAAQNKRAFTKEEVIKMREEYDNGKSAKQILKEYAPNKAYSTIYNIVTRQTYKDI